MFHYGTYWHTWSRVLSQNEPHRGAVVEANLTPIHERDGQSAWEKEVAPIRIRRHGTVPNHDDKLVTELPPEVREQMVANLGEELTNRLLTEDFLSQIDWKLYDKVSNGGANLEDIRKR